MIATRLMTVAVVAAAGMSLSACGTTSPGTAATVGDVEISNTRVNEVAGHFCTAFETQPDDQRQTVPMSFVKQYVVQGLVLRAQAEQLAQDRGLTPSADYETAVAQVRDQASEIPEEARADYVELSSINALANDVVQQVGRQVLEDQGIEDATEEQVSQAGIDAFTSWPDANGIEIDPRYGLKNVDGELVQADAGTSIPVGERASAFVAPTETDPNQPWAPDPDYVDALPANQRCG